MSYVWFIPVIGGVSFLLTAALRKYALFRSLIDIPNARSSHSVPTPRGGGVAIVLAFLLASGFLFFAGIISSSAFLAIAGAGAAIAVIGFMDDHGHIAARWRLLGHFGAAGWLLFWLGGLPAIELWGVSFNLGWLGHVLALFYLVWLLNLYNFMDGIDGIASLEAICVCLGACLLYWIAGLESLIWAPLLLAVAVVGFLCWNFPPARIFMGDAGSGFLGIVLGGLSMQAAWASAPMLWAWLILLGVFIVDATFTLFRRLLRGDKIYEAHRSHAYQFAFRHFGKHLPVILAVGLINLFWLLPIAICVTRYGLNGVLGVILAYAPLLMLAVKFRAGTLEESSLQG
ncbi:glycosyltransferase family 4 protein [Pseudomonas sp. SK3(2021)]|uniref:MraY family glycosyltransferase n=1 Tax=Pseudomonas sp. SK3(2021) TaxID=2841064 RepID=UPI00192BC0EA|nr:glycosyltransferase family 4 protein [Pseudomonas sp. SK3(2021)]QQZ40465.1 glycosyltransferase family 4 protein [Pseudomonas sp. SK3(2021)]